MSEYQLEIKQIVDYPRWLKGRKKKDDRDGR